MVTETDFKINADTIAANNPKVDLKVVEEARNQIAERRANGRQRRGYTLASPHSRKLTRQ